MKANRHRGQLLGKEVSNVAGWRWETDHESGRKGQNEPQYHPREATEI